MVNDPPPPPGPFGCPWHYLASYAQVDKENGCENLLVLAYQKRFQLRPRGTKGTRMNLGESFIIYNTIQKTTFVQNSG